MPLVRVFNTTSSGVSTGTTETIAVDATGFQAGHVLVLAAFNRRSANVSLTSVTDTQGNTWTVGQDGHSTLDELVTATAYLTKALGSTDTITLTWSATSVTNTATQIHEWSNILSASFIDANPVVTSNGATTTVSGPAVTTTVHDVIVAFFGQLGSSTVTGEAAGWTYAGTQCATGGPTRLDSIYIDEPTPSTYTPSVTYSAAVTNCRQAAVALKVSVAPFNTVAPAVTGTAKVGQTLSCTTGTWTDDGSPTFTYQWQRGGVNIGGATASTYLVQSADVGATLACVVTDSTPDGNASASSNSVGPVPQPLGPKMLGYYTQ